MAFQLLDSDDDATLSGQDSDTVPDYVEVLIDGTDEINAESVLDTDMTRLRTTQILMTMMMCPMSRNIDGTDPLDETSYLDYDSDGSQLY